MQYLARGNKPAALGRFLAPGIILWAMPISNAGELIMTEVTAPSEKIALQNNPLFSRIFEAAGCSTQVELANFLGISQSSISEAKKRGSIPADWLLTLLCKKWVNPTWVLTGQGARLLQPSEHELLPEKITPTILQCPLPQCITDELMQKIVRRAVQGIAQGGGS